MKVQKVLKVVSYLNNSLLSSSFFMVDKLLHIGVKFCSNFSLKQTIKGVK